MKTGRQNTPLEKLLARLRMFKTLVGSGQFEDIELNIQRIIELENGFSKDTKIIAIFTALQSENYRHAVNLIDQFLLFNTVTERYIDPELEALQREFEALEDRLAELQAEEISIESLINEFNARFEQTLGQFLEIYLKLKESQYLKLAAENSLWEWVHKHSQKERKEHHKTYLKYKDQVIAVLTLDEDEEIKRLFREAIGKCHPDYHPGRPDLEELAKKLIAARKAKDLKTVREIHQMLFQGNIGKTTEPLNNKEILRARIKKIKARISTLSRQVSLLKTSSEYIKIKNIENWDKYFAEQKRDLQAKIETLKAG